MSTFSYQKWLSLILLSDINNHIFINICTRCPYNVIVFFFLFEFVVLENIRMLQVILVSSWINHCFSNVITIKVQMVHFLYYYNYNYYYYYLHQENTYLPGDVSSFYFKTKKVTKLINFLEDHSKLSGVDIADLSTCNNTYNLCNNVTGFSEFECLPGRKGNNCSIGIHIFSIHIYLNLWKEKKICKIGSTCTKYYTY